MNDCKYGWDKPADNKLRLTIFHTPAVGSSYTYQATNSFGTHRMLLAVLGHTNDWRSGGSSQAAARLNQPLQAFQALPHTGALGKSFGFLSCNNANVAVRAVKKAEGSSEIVVRLQELAGQTQTAQLTFASSILTARQVTGAEEAIGTLTPSGGALTVSLGAYQPMTLALTLAPPASSVATAISLPATLPYNADGISSDGNRADGDFDNGHSYPAELMPTNLVRDGLTFQFGPTNDGAYNMVACQGQTLSLAPGYNRLYLLAAAATNDLTATFTVGSQPTNLTVRYYSGFIGQWNPPWLKRDETGFICTHRHSAAGTNEAYVFCYLFKYQLDLPGTATTLTLPNAPGLRIFAMSLATNTPDLNVAGGPLGQNLQPWANAGLDRTLNAPASNTTASVTLDASGSADPDGTITSYVWSMNGSVVGTGVSPTVSLPIGTNVISLTITDDQGATGDDVVTIAVLPPLAVSLTATPTNSTSAPLTVQFAASASGGPPASDTTDDHVGTITAQGQNSPNEMATNAFDNILSSKWLDFATNYPGTRQSWIQYQYSNNVQRVGDELHDYVGQRRGGLPGAEPGGVAFAGLERRRNELGDAGCADQPGLQRVAADPGGGRWRAPAPTMCIGCRSIRWPTRLRRTRCSWMRSSSSGPAAFSYWWSFGDGTGSTLQNPQHTFTNPGSYRVILGVTCGAYTGTNSALITIGPSLGASITGHAVRGRDAADGPVRRAREWPATATARLTTRPPICGARSPPRATTVRMKRA